MLSACGNHAQWHHARRARPHRRHQARRRLLHLIERSLAQLRKLKLLRQLFHLSLRSLSVFRGACASALLVQCSLSCGPIVGELSFRSVYAFRRVVKRACAQRKQYLHGFGEGAQLYQQLFVTGLTFLNQGCFKVTVILRSPMYGRRVF